MTPTDEELYRRARGSEDALVELYRRHARAILGFCARRTNDPELAADVCSEVFAALVDQILSRRRPPESVSGWLHGTARNKIADAQRRGSAEARARTRLGMPRIALDDEGIARVLETANDVTAALSTLPDDQREAVEARVLRDQGYDTIAAEQSISEANARQRVTRGLARLRTTLEVSDD